MLTKQKKYEQTLTLLEKEKEMTNNLKSQAN